MLSKTPIKPKKNVKNQISINMFNIAIITSAWKLKVVNKSLAVDSLKEAIEVNNR
jgi:hypothetical protein